MWWCINSWHSHANQFLFKHCCSLLTVYYQLLEKGCGLPFAFHRTRFFYFCDVKLFVFAFRWFRVFHWGCYVYFRIVFSSNSLYILYIFIFIYFFIVLVVPYSALTDYDRSVVLTLDDRPDPQLWGHCRSTHNSSMICFFCVCSGFSLASWRWTGCPKETIAI